jgi:lipopolysaccharide transport system ATP-binding protein
VARYYEDLRSVQVDTQTAVASQRFRRGSGAVRFSGIRIHDTAGEDRYEFQMGETVRFTLGYEVLTPVSNLYVCVQLKSAFSGEVVTSVRYPVSRGPLPAGNRGALVIELPNVPLRPGEYPLYFWLGNEDSYPYDVVDELTAPLMVQTDKGIAELGFDPTQACGCFSIEARLLGERPQSI